MTSLEQRGSRFYLLGKRSVTLKAFLKLAMFYSLSDIAMSVPYSMSVLKLAKFYSLSDIAMSVPNCSDEWL